MRKYQTTLQAVTTGARSNIIDEKREICCVHYLVHCMIYLTAGMYCDLIVHERMSVAIGPESVSCSMKMNAIWDTEVNFLDSMINYIGKPNVFMPTEANIRALSV